MIARRNFLFKFLGLLATAAAPGAARAERKKGHAVNNAPEPAAKKNETAQLRLWKATDAPGDALGIRLLPPGKPDSAALSVLKADGSYYQFSSYAEVPAAPLMAEISAPGQPTLLLPLPLAAGSQSTLFIRLQKASLSAEWIDDTPARAEDGCEFRVYNLLPASGDIQISLGTVLMAHLASARSSLCLEGIKPGTYPLSAVGTNDGDKNFQLTLDVNLSHSRRATLCILSDPYGRIRPQLDIV